MADSSTSSRAAIWTWAFALFSAALFWYLMMAAHEVGHVLHAVATGGSVQRVVLAPLEFSRTDVAPNPSPLWVVWGGPLWGTVIPVILWVTALALRLRIAGWLMAWAGFCAVANGLYIASGVVAPAGDTEDLIRLGVEEWLLAAIGVPVVAAGFWIWHAMGPGLGFTSLSVGAARKGALVLGAVLTVTVVLMLMFGGR